MTHAKDEPDMLTGYINEMYPDLHEIYRWFHAHPELSGKEVETAEVFARELAHAGCAVTRDVGGHGVVGVLRNGEGPTVLVRADMDALPIREETGLPYASTVTTHDRPGREAGVMHACGHDIHMTVAIGIGRLFAAIRERWSGSLIIVGQPSEEGGLGAERMVRDGLYKRFPRPDCALALHVGPQIPFGTVGFHPGEFSSGSETLDLLIRGRGGHSAYPEETIDPVVLAAQTVIALQTIISRGRSPHEFAVLTVAQIHGGNKNNAIPDEVALQINIRYYVREVRDHLLAAILRVARGTAAAAGVPEDRMPVLSIHKDAVPPLRNDPSLTMRCIEACRNTLGDAKVIDLQPLSGSEDFGIFGSVEPPIPLCYFRIGCDDPEVIRAAKQSGEKLPYLHSSRFAPLPEPTIKTGIIAMGAAVLGLLRK